MRNNLEKIFAGAGRVVEAAAGATEVAIEKGKVALDGVAVQKRIDKLQNRLGMLVYQQKKTNDLSDERINRCIEELDHLYEQLALLQKAKADIKLHTCTSCGTEVEKGAMFCSCCGKELS